MLDSTKKELEKLMNSYNHDLEGLKAKKDREKADQDTFVREFERLKHEIIWPVIIEIGNQINTYGHDYFVSEEDEYIDATARFQPSIIRFDIYPAGLDRSTYKRDCTPYVAFFSNRYAKKVGIMVSTMVPSKGGVIGFHGEYDVNQITREFVENEIITVLKNSLILHVEK